MKRITLVSTDETLSGNLERELIQHGFTVDAITDTDNLFEKIKRSNPNILLIDFILDDSNAAAVCHQLKSNPATHAVHIIVLSDSTDIEQIAAKFGSFSIIKKPVVIENLIETLKAASLEHISPL